MPITEAQLLEKEAALKKVQTKLEGLLNDDIPDEEQPEILELKQKVEMGLSSIQKMKETLSKSINAAKAPQKEANANASPSDVIKEENTLDKKQLGSLLKQLNADLKKAQSLSQRLTDLGQNSTDFEIAIQSKGVDRAAFFKELDQLIQEGKDWIVVWNNEINDFKTTPNAQNNQMDIVLNLKREFAIFTLSASAILNVPKEKSAIPEHLRKKIIQIEKIAKPLRAWLKGLNKGQAAIGSIDDTILLLKELNTVVSLARINNPMGLVRFTEGQLRNRTVSLATSKSWGEAKIAFAQSIAFEACIDELEDPEDPMARKCQDLLIGQIDPVKELKKLASLLEEIRVEIEALDIQAPIK